MNQHLTCVALLVRDHDEPIAWFRDTLGFALIEDSASATRSAGFLISRWAPNPPDFEDLYGNLWDLIQPRS
jgi:catechol 2,3-dioxygenase-like lactoylglutathione lyase family enzyme